MGKRVFLFLATNLAIVIVMSVVFSLLGIGGYVGADGQLQLVPLAIFCLVWGMGGALISLQISRWIAKRAMGVKLVDGRSGNADLDWLHATVSRQAERSGLPVPEIGYYESEELNACVMFLARIVAFGVRQAMDSRLAGVVSFVVMIVLQIALGLLASLVTAWFSRQREFRADAAAANLAGRENMTAALRRLMTTTARVDTSNAALATFKIAGGKSWLTAFSTHPPLEERIAALQSGRPV
jgi:heat shock protein HtpX